MEGLWVMCGKIKIRRGLFFWLLRYLRFIDYVGFKEFWLYNGGVKVLSVIVGC